MDMHPVNGSSASFGLPQGISNADPTLARQNGRYVTEPSGSDGSGFRTTGLRGRTRGLRIAIGPESQARSNKWPDRLHNHASPSARRTSASAAYCAQLRRYAAVLQRRCFLDGTLSSDPRRSLAGQLRRPGSGSQSGCRGWTAARPETAGMAGSSDRSLVGHRCRGRRERGDRAVRGCRQRHRCRGHEGVRRRVYGAVEVHPSGGRRRWVMFHNVIWGADQSGG